MVNLSLMEQFGIKSIQLFDKIRPDNNKNGNNEKIRGVGKLSIIIRKSFVKIKSGSAAILPVRGEFFTFDERHKNYRLFFF